MKKSYICCCGSGKRLLSRRGAREQWPDAGTGSCVGRFTLGAHTSSPPRPTARSPALGKLQVCKCAGEGNGRQWRGGGEPTREREISLEFNSLFPKEQLMDYDKCPTALP